MKQMCKKIGEDFKGSVELGMVFALAAHPGWKVKVIRLHPLDQTLSEEKWPYGWPPLVVDDKTPRHFAVFDLVHKDKPEQLTLI